MKIAIVDDEKSAFDCLQGYLTEALGASLSLARFESGEAFLAAWAPGIYDLVILDIFMGRLNGMEVAKTIRKTDRDVRIVFSTTSNEFASESYEVGACYYLHKPFGKERVMAMLDRIDLAQIEKMRTVTLPDGTAIVLRDILWADYAAHYTTLHCKQGKTVNVRTNFSEIESLLCAYPYFFSPSKGMVVNFHEVAAQNADTFLMSDRSRVPISRRKAKEVLDAYSSFLFDKLRKGGSR